MGTSPYLCSVWWLLPLTGKFQQLFKVHILIRINIFFLYVYLKKYIVRIFQNTLKLIYFYRKHINFKIFWNIYYIYIFFNIIVTKFLKMVFAELKHLDLFRYILISKSDIYNQLYTSRGITVMLIVVWTLSFFMLLPPLLEIWGTLGLDSATFSCTILKKNGSSPKKFLFVLGFLVPCIVISVSYLCIYWRVRRSRKNLEAHAAESGQRSGGFQRREDSRVTRLMLTIFLCFLMCFMPLMLVNVIDEKIKIPILHVVASVLAWASAVINPFIYAGTNKLYREAYKQILCPTSSRTHIVRLKPPHSHSSKVSSPHTT